MAVANTEGAGYVEPGVSDRQRDSPRTADEPKDKAKWAYRLERAQHARIERRIVEHRVNARRRQGEFSVYAHKRQDIGTWDVYIPPGSSKAPIPIYNKSARLCSRIISYILSDVPKPQVDPTRDDDDSKDAASVAQQGLDSIIGPEELNLEEQVRRALDQSNVCGTAFIHLWVDPYGGGQQSVEVEAHPYAQHLGEATRSAEGVPHNPEELTRRYVSADIDEMSGQPLLTDETSNAKQQWRPAVRAEVHPASHVLFLPNYTTFGEAHGCLIREYRPWGHLKRRYPNLADLDDEAIREICKHEPKGWSELWPIQDGKPKKPSHNSETPVDDLLCAHLRVWFTECPDYPDGLFVAVVGEKDIAADESWVGQDQVGRFQMELPIVPVQLWRKDDDPWGSEATMDILGPSGEARAAIMGMMFDHLDKLGRRKVFVPQTSIYSGKEALLDYLTYIPINPGGKPEYEEIPPMPQEIPTVFASLSREMDDASTLGQVAQSTEGVSGQSGRAKLAVISQVQANLSDAQTYIATAFLRSWRLCLQLARQKYTVPQTTEFVGEDGAYQVTRWMGSDLTGSHDLSIKAGTGTMLSQQQKIEQALSFQQAGIVQLPDVLESVGASVGAMLGIRDNPHRHRIRRSISQWEKGPPADQPEPPPMQAPPQQVGVDPMGQPIMGPPAPPQPQPHPAGLAIFMPKPVDLEPAVASWRARELGRTMAGIKYDRMPKSWQMALDQAYATAIQALQPPPTNPMPGAEQQAPAPSPSAAPALTPNELAMGGLTNTQGSASI